MKIGIISVAYDDFDFEAFYKNIENYFLPNHKKIYYFFTNKTEQIYKKNVNIYYSRKDLSLYQNINDVINDIIKDGMNLIFYSNLKIKLGIKNGYHMMPQDNSQFVSLNENNEPMFYNLPALIDHIKGQEDKMIYGSYLDNFIQLIKYYTFDKIK